MRIHNLIQLKFDKQMKIEDLEITKFNKRDSLHIILCIFEPIL